MRELLAAVKIWLQAGACVYATAMLIAISSPAFAEEGNLKDGAKRAGRAVGSVAHDIGHGAKKVGKEIGQGAKQAGMAIGEAAKEGGKEFRRAVKGE